MNHTKTIGLKTVSAMFMLALIILLISGIANAGSDIKFSIKSKSLGIEKGKEKVLVNITVDKSADLLYREDRYLDGSFQSEESRSLFLRDNLSSSFTVLRPRDVSDIKFIVLYKKKTIFEQWLNSSNKFKLDYDDIPKKVNGFKTNISKKTNSSNTNVSKKTVSAKTNVSKKTVSAKTNVSKKTNSSDTNVSKTSDENLKKSPGYGIVTTVLVAIVTFVLIKNRKIEK